MSLRVSERGKNVHLYNVLLYFSVECAHKRMKFYAYFALYASRTQNVMCEKMCVCMFELKFEHFSFPIHSI